MKLTREEKKPTYAIYRYDQQCDEWVQLAVTGLIQPRDRWEAERDLERIAASSEPGDLLLLTEIRRIKRIKVGERS